MAPGVPCRVSTEARSRKGPRAQERAAPAEPQRPLDAKAAPRRKHACTPARSRLRRGQAARCACCASRAQYHPKEPTRYTERACASRSMRPRSRTLGRFSAEALSGATIGARCAAARRAARAMGLCAVRREQPGAATGLSAFATGSPPAVLAMQRARARARTRRRARVRAQREQQAHAPASRSRCDAQGRACAAAASRRSANRPGRARATELLADNCLVRPVFFAPAERALAPLVRRHVSAPACCAPPPAARSCW